MAVPKRRLSRSRTRRRRAHWLASATVPLLTTCGCARREITVSHRACSACGRLDAGRS